MKPTRPTRATIVLALLLLAACRRSDCDADLSNDVASCGACDHRCEPADDAAPVCASGTCGLSCLAGFQDCDGDGASGCESALAGDAAHCGSCGAAACAAAAPFCSANGCVATIGGVQQNVSAAALQGMGWTLCHAASFSASYPISSVESACDGSQLLIACRTTGSDTLLVAAAAARSDVLFATGAGNAPHEANGVAWYFDADSSWGFAPAGSSIDRRPCDIAGSAQDAYAGGAGAQRLCWMTRAGDLIDGGRCGDVFPATIGGNHQRVVFTR